MCPSRIPCSTGAEKTMSTAALPRVSRPPLVALALLSATALGLAATGRGPVSAAPGSDPSRLAAADAPGDSRVDPVPLNRTGQAGPWKLTVTQVVTGQDATNQVTAANSANEAPADGSTYVLVKIRAENTGSRPLAIGGDDFAVTGRSGLVRRFAGAFPPDPALDATVKPGETKEGWVVLGAASDEQSLLLLFDSLSLPGTWADRVFALQPGATVPNLTQPPAKPDAAGKDPAKPVGLNTPVTTADWQIQILQVAAGQDVYNLYPQSDYRTTALGINAADSWLALRVKVTNVRTGGAQAFFPPTAFMLADGQGHAVNDVEILTPPNPDASGGYYPGASREGWVVFELPADYNANLVRFLPYRTDTDPRYLAFGQTAGAPTATQPAAPLQVQTGASVVVTDDGVNMRDSPSTDGGVVETLKNGTELQVTGDPQQGGSYAWYPVTDPATGNSGFVAQNFLKAKS